MAQVKERGGGGEEMTIKNADFTVPIPKVTDPLDEKESKCSEVPFLGPPNHLCATFALFTGMLCAAVLLNTEGEEEKKSV